MEQARSIPEKYWLVISLIIWGGLMIGLGLVRFDAYGLDEGAARALMLNWSVADNVVNPIFVLGAPDFRALLFFPIGVYWTGNMIAAKIFSLVIAFIGTVMLYRWARRIDNSESALIASALFLISPVLLQQVDSMGTGPYILLTFALGAWLDAAYRKTDRYFGAWYFLQLVWIAIVISLHPIGLAYPLALAYWWYSNPHASKKSRHIFIGISISSLFALAITMGWSAIDWFSNPFATLSAALEGHILESAEHINWVPGIILSFALAVLLFVDYAKIKQDFLGLMLLLGLIIGLVASDGTWATLAVAFVLFRGIARLNSWNQARETNGFLGQKGAVLIVGFVLSTFFMLQAKAHWIDIRTDVLSQEDQLIENLAAIAQDKNIPFRAASQWPGRTMLATRRDVLPLPPAFSNAEELYEKAVSGVTHILFDPYDSNNQALAKNLALLVSATETLQLNRSAALVAVKEHKVQLHVRPNEVAETTQETEVNDNNAGEQ